MKRTSPLFALAVLGFCVWQARDLLNAWSHAPFDRFDPLAFAVWVLPVAFVWSRRRIAFRVNPVVLLTAAAMTMSGAMLDLNVLQNFALATVLSSFVVSRTFFVPWLLAAASWMPVFGWAISGWGFTTVATARLMVAAVASTWGCWLLVRQNESRVA